MVTTQTQEKVASFFSKYPEVRYKKGTMILQPEDSIVSIFYLMTGYVRMYSILSDGKELTLNIFKPGSYFPLFLAFANSQNSYFFQTMTAVTVRKAPKIDVVQFIKGNSDVLFDFTRRMSIGFYGLLSSLQYQLFGSVRRRITSTLVLLSKRFGEHLKDGIYITLQLTHQDIANLTGVARETASVELEKLQKQDIISYAHKKIIIHNLKALDQEVLVSEEMQPLGFDV